jgi:hypothetical protein
MDKSKFKKLALMGITGGILSMAQAPASADASIGTILAAKCGAGSCGGANRSQGSCGGAPRPQGSCGGAPRAQGSCGGAPRPQGSCGGAPRAQGSCGGQNYSRGYNFTADAGNMPQMQDQRYQQNQQQKDLSENELLMVLSPETRAVYMSMDADGRALALKLANADCKGKNDCKGLNACKSATNSCAGLGSCQGTTVGPFRDKNSAVKVAAKKMAEKRTSMNRRNNNEYNSY